MVIHFHKYQGTGNDFILIDDRDEQFPINRQEIISFMCDRKMGIGADGLILIQTHPEVDFRMVYFNPDGSKSLCGNGSRCAMAFAKTLNMVKDRMTFETTDGVHEGVIDGLVYRFHLHDVNEVRSLNNAWFINTGSPHYIAFVDDLDQIDVLQEGRRIRYSEPYQPSGTNVNFVEKTSGGIKVRTYERGVEDETLSCGTGVTACALAASFQSYESPVSIETKGGALTVSFDKIDEAHFKNIYLSGPAKKVYEGSIEVPI